MGIVQHDVIIATTWDEKLANDVVQWYSDEFGELLILTRSYMNSYWTLILPPDGSKEGWVKSNEGDSRREQLLDRLRECAYEDGSNPWRWVEVSYGELGHRLTSGERPSEI